MVQWSKWNYLISKKLWCGPEVTKLDSALQLQQEILSITARICLPIQVYSPIYYSWNYLNQWCIFTSFMFALMNTCTHTHNILLSVLRDKMYPFILETNVCTIAKYSFNLLIQFQITVGPLCECLSLSLSHTHTHTHTHTYTYARANLDWNRDDNLFWWGDWRLSVLLYVWALNVTLRFHHCLHFLFNCVFCVCVSVYPLVWGKAIQSGFFSKNKVFPWVQACAQNDNEGWGCVLNKTKPGRCQKSWCHDDDTLFPKNKINRK